MRYNRLYLFEIEMWISNAINGLSLDRPSGVSLGTGRTGFQMSGLGPPNVVPLDRGCMGSRIPGM